MTDWNAFCSLASSVVTAYSDSSLKRCLVYLDPKVLDELSLKDRLLMRTGVTSSKRGRDSCFLKLFQYIHKRHPDLFTEAPQEAVAAYNTLVDFLFTADVAKSLAVSSAVQPMTPKAVSNGAMPFEKRLAVFTGKAEIFGDLAVRAKACTTLDVLAELEQEFDARQSKLSLLLAKKQKLAGLIRSLPKAAPDYLQPLKQPDDWQKLYSVVAPFYEMQNGNGLKFSDLASFEAWAFQEDALLKDVLQAASKLATAKTLEVPVDIFIDELRGVPASLYQAHVLALIPIIEQKILGGQDESQIKDFLQKQREKIIQIDQFYTNEAEAVKTRSSPYVQKLFGGELLSFTDIPNEVKRILSKTFEPKIIEVAELSDEIVAEYIERAKAFYEGVLGELAALVDTANARGEKLAEMSEYVRAFKTITAPAKQFKDLKSEYSSLDDNINFLIMQRQDFANDSFAENEKQLQGRYSRYVELKANMPQAIDRLIQGAALSEQRAEDDKSAIKRRLFEIFWNISPYLDLMESFQDMRKMLSSQLKDGMRKVYAGEMSTTELLGICQEMPYEHDVVKLRNEITHRSARLKDLRDEVMRLLGEVQETRRFLEIAGLAYHDIQEHQATIQAILSDVENPFKAFAKAETKDDINYVFRKFWIRIEEVQPRVEEAQNAAQILLQQAAPTLKAAFIKALDTLEEAISLKTGSRAQLVFKVEQELNLAAPDELYNSLLSQMHAVEKRYGYARPFSFLMRVPEHKTRLTMLQEAAVLDTYITETIDFAKAMQYVKTFEEERVDIILEAFEKQHIILDADNTVAALKSAWDLYRERMHRAARLVEDEIFLDIGLLDRHALMDVDQKELIRTLRIAIERAKMHIFEPKYGLLANLQSAEGAKDALCQMTLNSVKSSLNAWANVSLNEDKSIDWLLEHLRNYCHNLFDAKIILGSNAKMLLPKCLDFMNEMRVFVSSIETSLQGMRSKHLTEWGLQWIPECHSMRFEIESFEPEDETADAFEPLVKKIYAIADQIPERSQLQLEAFQKELKEHLVEIDVLAKDPKKDHPFIYIPGYLAFFDVGVGT